MGTETEMGSRSLSLLDLLLGEHFSYAKPTGSVKVERVLGKSVATHVHADYPLQFMIPKKATPADVDSVLVYALNFGGGIVSGDAIFCELKVGEDTTVVLTTQGCTNVFKSVKGQTSHQTLKASVGSGALLAVLPDSLVCFANARYSQVQAFDIATNGNLVLVDWLTSGRVARGEIWNFDLFKSINHIYIEGDTPLLLDSVCLEQGMGLSIADRMDDFQVLGLVVIYGPKLALMRKAIQSNVQSLTARAMKNQKSFSSRGASAAQGSWPKQTLSTHELFASCSPLGPSEEGLVVRVAARETKTVYQFLKEQLSALQPLIGIPPYARR
ncbi:unnamed protein product [Calypogeia fissa]